MAIRRIPSHTAGMLTPRFLPRGGSGVPMPDKTPSREALADQAQGGQRRQEAGAYSTEQWAKIENSLQHLPQSIGNEQSGSAESRRKPSLAMVRKPGTVLSDKLFQHRLALGSRRHVEGGTWSERVLFLHGRREGRGGGLCVCLNCEDQQKGIERALPIIAEAIAAGRLTAWVDDRCQAGKVETLRTKSLSENIRRDYKVFGA
jgi:hypothetical protein